ncbi:SPOSA6832_02359 [Sporobolomyces salmonicolor]|uniref:SPOSA6832_02359-mRNA-1:cds n=1 Tax=Sporidiobolus salmonicolor TaxID=5005 RepID=A0A0D6ELX4_SPOSA|nr:SPOSA6832_02359 [Sporobolomyces salmonicolor]
MDELTGLPLAFGKQAPKSKVDPSRIETTKRQDAQASTSKAIEAPDEPRAAQPGEDGLAAADGAAAGEEDDLPVTHEIVMKDHSKTVSALSVDPSGARVVSGSYDYDLKLWDFGGMKSDFKPFRGWECKPGHQVLDVQFSITGDAFLAANGSTQVKLYDRDGAEIGEFNKGDMYIRDLRHTDGHVAAVTSVAWHPTNPALFLTASADSTLRIWERDSRRKSKSVIVVKSKERGGKTKVTACGWSPDGKTIAAACEDGAIHLWAASSNLTRPSASCDKAHEKGTTTSAIVFSPDGKYLATRGGDGTVKLWNPKSLKKPIHTAEGLPSLNAETNVAFSPDGRFVLTGTAGAHAGVLAGAMEEEKARELEKGEGVKMGRVVVLRTEGLGVVRTLDISPFSVVKVLWHPKINQILTGSSSGAIHVLYSPLSSTKGATLAVTRTPRARAPDDFSTADGLDRPIVAPHSLPMFKEEGEGTSAGGRGGKRKRERERHDPVKSFKPSAFSFPSLRKWSAADCLRASTVPPVVGPGRGGRVGASATQHVVQGLVRNTMRDQDPREALLKYATADPSDNTWTQAWAKTQPKPVFDTRVDDDDEEEEKRPT